MVGLGGLNRLSLIEVDDGFRIVPTLLRGNDATDAPRSALGTRSVPGCIPTRSVGTINQQADP
ncbi:hypothetical protein CGA22_23065 [Pseudomonas sp. PSB18]|nr:hypothetical protein [Pseudomonas sp. PSB18]